MPPRGGQDLGWTIDTRSCGASAERDRGGVSLYGDATRALRQVILLDERVRNTAVDLTRMSQEVADLRDRVSRLEGMVAAGMAISRETNPSRDRRRLREPSEQTGGGGVRTDNPVEAHYTSQSLGEAILAALKAAGKDLDHLTPDDLAPVDEFHGGQRPGTVLVAGAVGLSRTQSG